MALHVKLVVLFSLSLSLSLGFACVCECIQEIFKQGKGLNYSVLISTFKSFIGREMENAQLQGEVPVSLFSLPNLQSV